MIHLVAEIGSNHLGSFDRLEQTIRAAAGALATDVKLQVFRQLWRDRPTPPEWIVGRTMVERAAELAGRLGMGLVVSVFSLEDLETVRDIPLTAIKIASSNALDFPLISEVLAYYPTVWISLGGCYTREVRRLLKRQSGCLDGCVLMYCVQRYPATPSMYDLRMFQEWQKLARYAGAEMGISDHTLGVGLGPGAVALGAVVVEKHFRLPDVRSGPDWKHSVTPDQFKTMAQACIEVAAACRLRDVVPPESVAERLNRVGDDGKRPLETGPHRLDS